MSLQCSAYFCIEVQSFAVICRREDCLPFLVGDEEVRMVDNKELESGLKVMAEDFHLPGGGHKKLSHLVAGHICTGSTPPRAAAWAGGT